ncbi:MAG: pentapeptide repeat-containing protein [Myxococcales bacterium]|nr:pentapeptide repeat-containing protein [Myxococcales bacterium]
MSSPLSTRVAVVQLAYHPAAVLEMRSPLEDPLFEIGKPDSLLPANGHVPPVLEERFAALQRRVRAVYCEQLTGRLLAILAACRGWGVRVVVFPEYSVPWDVLPVVAAAAGDMVVVAGTHQIERDARGVYPRLGWPKEQVPPNGTAVCPVLFRGRLVGLQAKLKPAEPERKGFKPGTAWAPIRVEDALNDAFGVLICLDFLHREHPDFRALVGPHLEECRFLCVPSLTPHYTLGEFAARAQQEARRYGRPVLYCDIAGGGGTAIYVDEGAPRDLRDFPVQTGYLDPGDEGVIVADVDLGLRPAGPSTKYESPLTVTSYAAASLVYTAHPVLARYVELLAAWSSLGEGDEGLEAAIAAIASERVALLNVVGLPGQSRARRLQRMLRGLQRIPDLEELRKFTREVVLPPNLLPFSALRLALARGAGDQVFAWVREHTGSGMAEVEERLRTASASLAAPDSATWTEEGVQALRAVQAAMVEATASPEPAPPRPPPVVVQVPELDLAALGERRCGAYVVEFHRDPRGRVLALHGRKVDERGVDRASRALLGDLIAERMVRGKLAPDDGDEGFRGVHNAEAARSNARLARAEGLDRVTTVYVRLAKHPEQSAWMTLVARGEAWELWPSGDDPWGVAHGPAIAAALGEVVCGADTVRNVPLEVADREARIRGLLGVLVGVRERIAEARESRLREVGGHFVDPDVTMGSQERSGLEGLDVWSMTASSMMLVLGQFGSGKSTLLAEWAHRCWQKPTWPRPVLVALAGAAGSPWSMLHVATGVADTPAGRAALELLVTRGHLIPCFDGLDEMATRISSAELGARIEALAAVTDEGGRIILAARDHYFDSDEALGKIVRMALGDRGRPYELKIQPLREHQVREVLDHVCGSEHSGDLALRKIQKIYDLPDLINRPLLLAMVAQTLDSIEPGARVGTADIYEAYLERWLEQTHLGEAEAFSDVQKQAFAEALAEQMWRLGQTACTWADLQKSVREVLIHELPTELPLVAVYHEIQGGAFFVREGEASFRFAHRSFQEFFLARGLIRTLAARPEEALKTLPLTREVVAFVGGLLRRGGEPRAAVCVLAVQTWLVRGRVEVRAPEAAANAVRLLHGLATWVADGTAWIPEGADLRGVSLAREELRGLRAPGCDLRRADLVGCDLADADLRRARLDDACLAGASLNGAKLGGASLVAADLTLVEADRVDLTYAELQRARLRQSTWTECVWTGVELDGADVTSWAVLGSQGPTVAKRPSALATVLAPGHAGAVTAVTWSPDGRSLASASDDSVRIWDAASGACLSFLLGHKNVVQSVAWSPDGRRLASASEDKSVRIWDAASGACLFCLQDHENAVWSVAWSPDGRYLASASDDNSVRIWDAASGVCLTSILGHEDGVLSAVWSPDGCRLASASSDRSVRIWDATLGACLSSIRGHKDAVLSVAWSPDGRRLASASRDKSVRIWDVASGVCLSSLLGHDGAVFSVAWSPDGRQLASTSSDKSVRIWDTTSGDYLFSLLGHEYTVLFITWSPDGRRLATASNDKSVRVWDTASGVCLSRLDRAYGATSVAWSPDGHRLASASIDKSVRIWDTASGACLFLLRGHENWVGSVAWSPDGHRLASVSADKSIRIWNAATGAGLPARFDHEHEVRYVTWSPDGQRLASAGFDDVVRIWDVTSGACLSSLLGHTGWVRSVAWSPGGHRIASASDDKTVRIWDATSGACRLVLRGHELAVKSVAWSPDELRFATASDDKSVRIWDAASGDCQKSLLGHKDGVHSVAWSPDNRRLASASSDNTVRIWDADSGDCLSSLLGHEDSVWCVGWSPDEHRLASASSDNTVRIWMRIDVSGTIETWRCLASLYGPPGIALTPGGFYTGADDNVTPLRVRVPRTDGTADLPLAGLRRVLERPDRVAAALAGDLSQDDPMAELKARGWLAAPISNGTLDIVSEARPRTVASAPDEPPSPRINPFLPGTPVPEDIVLAGRADLLEELLGLVAQARPIVVRGPRRAGKTSLVRRLVRCAPHARVLDLAGAVLRSEDDLARRLDPTLATVDRPFQELQRRLENGPRPTYLLDEVAGLLGAEPGVFALLRGLGQDRLASLVYAGTHRDWERVIDHAAQIAPGSSYGNDVLTLDLGPISVADAERLLVDTAPPDVALDAALAARVVRLCGPWPFYMQAMGYALVQRARVEDRRAFVDPAGLRDLYEGELLDRWFAVFRDRWGELPEATQALIRRLFARDDWTLDAPPALHGLSLLQRTLLGAAGLVHEGRWVPDPPFYDWLRRSILGTAS